jgi:hypothetical protein
LGIHVGQSAELILPAEENFIDEEHGKQTELAVLDFFGHKGVFVLPDEFRAKDDEHQKQKDMTEQGSVNNEYQELESEAEQCSVNKDHLSNMAQDPSNTTQELEKEDEALGTTGRVTANSDEEEQGHTMNADPKISSNLNSDNIIAVTLDDLSEDDRLEFEGEWAEIEKKVKANFVARRLEQIEKELA